MRIILLLLPFSFHHIGAMQTGSLMENAENFRNRAVALRQKLEAEAERRSNLSLWQQVKEDLHISSPKKTNISPAANNPSSSEERKQAEIFAKRKRCWKQYNTYSQCLLVSGASFLLSASYIHCQHDFSAASFLYILSTSLFAGTGLCEFKKSTINFLAPPTSHELLELKSK